MQMNQRNETGIAISMYRWWKTYDRFIYGRTDASFTHDTIVFIHQDFTVTETMWRDQRIVFDNVDDDWKALCANALRFKVTSRS